MSHAAPSPDQQSDGSKQRSGAEPHLSLTRVEVNSDTEFYWAATRNGELVAQRCLSCHQLWHPPSPICPHCQSLNWTVSPLPGEGTIYSATKVVRPGSPIQGDNYLVGLISIEDPDCAGPPIRLACNIRGCDLPDAAIGSPVELIFEPLDDGYQLPQFRLAAPTVASPGQDSTAQRPTDSKSK